MPILMGARGDRMLRLAAREANIIGVMASDTGGPGSNLADKIAVVREAAGQRYSDLELAMLFLQVRVDGEPAGAPQYPGRLGLIGSRAEIIDQLQASRDQHDVSYVTVIGTAIDAFAPVVAKLAGT